ncbi:MAG: bacteriohemerythrin [Candidatus Shapirobacteria bacterium]
MDIKNKLEWEEKYSVGVKLINDQHKTMFTTINKLIEMLSSAPNKEKIVEIINSLLEYKKFHFATEEKYFKEFNYQGATEHINAHQEFGKRLSIIQEKNKDNVLSLSYDLVDFLEDWLIDHLLTEDQKYKECFISHGLK